jgi:mRNA interferase RelE/StbE
VRGTPPAGLRAQLSGEALARYGTPGTERRYGTLDGPIRIGYYLARMRHEIVLAPSALRELRSLPAHDRAAVRDAMERHLRQQPRRVSKSRIKQLRGLVRPQSRLRVGDLRVFYDVSGRTVEILAVITKAQAERWLQEKGTRREAGSAGEG